MKQPTHLVLASLLAFPTALTAQVVTVSGGGNALMLAIQSAAPGATLLVAPGDYSGPLVIDKPLTVLGDNSTTTAVTAYAGPFALHHTTLTIQAIQPGEQVIVSGLLLRTNQGAFGAGANVLEIDDCAGAVAVRDLAFGNPGGLDSVYGFNTPGAVYVRNCTAVSIEQCSFELPSATETIVGMRVEDSLVFAVDSAFRGGSSRIRNGLYGADQAAGIVATDSELRLARCTVRGGNGVASPLFGTEVPDGSPAILAHNSAVHTRGATVAQGGDGNTAVGVGAAGAHMHAPSLLSTTPATTLIGGVANHTGQVAPATSGNGLHAALTFPLPIVSMAQAAIAPGATATWQIDAEPGAIALPLFDIALGPPFELPGVFGRFALAFAQVISLPATTCNANGQGAVSVAMPATPSLVGVTAHVQALTFGPGGWIAVSGPSTMSVQ